MLYTPKYCCECGEKIERENWSVLTSRRFCEVCEIEFKGYENLPKIGAAAIIIFGLFGAGNFLSRTAQPPPVKAAQIAQSSRTEGGGNTKESKANAPTPAINTQSAANQAVQTPPQLIASKPAAQNNSPIGALKTSENKSSADEKPDYYCGAATKKGTPCARRVKGGGRCWQHEGKPAILPPEKLLIAAK